MNAVLVQELARFNNLIEAIHSSLAILDRTLDGILVSTDDSEAMLRSVLQNELPAAWKAVSYPSKKSLLAYVEDLSHRISMLQHWIEAGEAPGVFWISGFFFTHSLLTGVRQNFARQSKVPIDKVTFGF